MFIKTASLLLAVLTLLTADVFCAVTYEVVYVRTPRAGDQAHTRLPEVFHPIRIEPGSDLMLLRPDGTEEVLVAGGDGAVMDPVVSFDGLWVYYAKIHDQRPEARDQQRRGAPARSGADIFKIHLQTREIVQLTDQEWTPNSGVIDWSNSLLEADAAGPYYHGYGIFNLGPCPLPGGKVMFTSSRNTFLPVKAFTSPNLQLYVMDNDGKNVELIGHMNLGSALHPTVLMDGRVMFSSYESQGLRDERIWGLWSIWPDGRNWEPLMSAFTQQQAFHFQTQLSNGDISVVDYYNLNNDGFGTLLAFPATRDATLPLFGSPQASANADIQHGIWWFNPSHPSHQQPKYRGYSFSPQNLYTLTPFSHSQDDASSFNLAGEYAGKVTHPSGAPNNSVLLTYSDGPVNRLNRPVNLPAPDAGIYLLPEGVPAASEDALILLKNDPAYNEIQPRALVPYKAIYGIEMPATLPSYANDGQEHPLLEQGTPFGIVGTSTFYQRDTKPGRGRAEFGGMDPFNSSENNASSNWNWQGSDAGVYGNSDIHAVRILSMEPSSQVSRGPDIGSGITKGFYNHAGERLRILGELPLRKFDDAGNPVRDSSGDPDTSFMAKIPADVPFTFQTLDKDGLALNTSQTWHQLRPGEVRNNCGGCHGHAQVPFPFEGTMASLPGYEVPDLSRVTRLLSKNGSGETTTREEPTGSVDVEYYRDIKPILERSCTSCHTESNGSPAPRGLVLDDTSPVDGYDGTYQRLAHDERAEHGIPPIIGNGTWRMNNASRYVRKFQSRRSLLMWKLMGRRLDGWTNADFPTESNPGDVTSLPAGATANHADIDFTGTMMPPPDSGMPALSDDEKMMFARWIDLGCPISTPEQTGLKANLGWFADELRPTLTITHPKAGHSPGPVNQLVLGAFDYYSGLNKQSLSVRSSLGINGQAAGAELAPLFTETGDHVWTLTLDPPLTDVADGEFTVTIQDTSGNITEIERTFSVGGMKPPRLSMLSVEGQRTQINLSGEAGQPHALETSPDMINWSPLLNVLDFDGNQVLTDPVHGGMDLFFYRAVRP